MSGHEIFPNGEIPETITSEYATVMTYLDGADVFVLDAPQKPTLLGVDDVRFASAHAFYGVSEVSIRGQLVAGVEYMTDEGWTGRMHATTVIQLPRGRRGMVEAGLQMRHFKDPLLSTVSTEPNIYVSISELDKSGNTFVEEWRIQCDMENQTRRIYRTTPGNGVEKVAEYARLIGLIPHIPIEIPFSEQLIVQFLNRGLGSIIEYIKHGSPLYAADIDRVYSDITRLYT